MNVKKSDRLYKTERLNYIVNRMRARQDITPTVLAQELHVSERTIYRDLRNLEKGNALKKRYSRSEGRYMLETELNLPPLMLTPSEAVAIYTAASNPALSTDNFFAPDLRSGLNKVARALAPQSALGTENGNGQASSTAFAISADSMLRPTLEIIRRAMRSNRKLRLAYWSAGSDSEHTLIVAPYDLRRLQTDWYLLASSEEQGALRTYKISRIRSAEILLDRFRYPRRFSADASFERAWETCGNRDEEIQVVLRFAPAAAELIAENRSFQFVKMMTEPDGFVVCTACINSVTEIAWWVLSFGSQVEVLSPPELRQRFKQTAQDMAALYANPPQLPHETLFSPKSSGTPEGSGTPKDSESKELVQA